jgi:DNA polymerase III delta subunit
LELKKLQRTTHEHFSTQKPFSTIFAFLELLGFSSESWAESIKAVAELEYKLKLQYRWVL